MGFGFKNSGGGGSSGGFVNTTTSYANYNALVAASVSPNTLNYVIASQGTKWLPFALGGTYYPNGWYFYDGINYTFQEAPFNASQPTVDAGTNNEQFVTPLTLENAAQIRYTNALPTPLSFPSATTPNIPAGSTFSAKKISEMFDAMLYPELNPVLTPPSSTFALTQSGLHEIAEVISILNFAAAFNRGSISPAYGTSGFRSGLPNTYKYTGSGLSNQASTSLTDARTVNNYSVLSGSQSWTSIVAFDGGEQPLTSKGNIYSTPLAAGDTSTKTVTITGVYPYFATTVNLTTLTKQSLALMTSAFVEVNMVAEDGINKQKIEFPTAWNTITGIQQYNTLNGQWEYIGGSKAASLTTFTTSSVTNTIQGNVINYTRYTHNGSTIGLRGLRFYTT